MSSSTGAPQSDYPNLDPYASSNGGANSVQGSVENAKNTVVDNAASAMNSISNSQTVQSLQNGPMADKARAETTATKNEFSNLANSRQTPETTTATGQSLTHYHSMFYSLLSWDNPRATAISFATTIIFIFATRYVPIIQYTLKALYVVLGITAAAELAGRVALGKGLATHVRPKKYYTIPRESLEAMLEDVEQLVNFFVIEAQRIIFAENISVTIAAFATSLIGYFLVKFVPKWGLALLSTTVIYLAPLIYIKNKDVIDGQLENVANIMNQQTQQVRDLAAHHSNKAIEVTSSTTKQYAAKASEMMGSAKKAAVDKGYVTKETAEMAPGQSIDKVGEPVSTDFPIVPKTEFASESTPSIPQQQAESGSAEPVAQ